LLKIAYYQRCTTSSSYHTCKGDSTRITKERKIIGRLFMFIWLTNIEDITCKYGILGRIFRFGDLIIESAGPYGRMEFKGMPGAKKD